ncbi:HAUS augmin-like complex subunit 5 [Cinclus cinclus]|uniref:HAUS augmin-like complex subunit 5 n=1 Tax=Cinclus cinclus TaxID=127875 RepID=UPI002E1080D2
MAEALGRWLREEMQLPPSAAPSPAVLRSPNLGLRHPPHPEPANPIVRALTAPIIPRALRASFRAYKSRHAPRAHRTLRNVKKIRGNLRWYRHLQELEAAAGPPSRKEALVAEVARLRKELQDLGDAIEDSQEEARRLEASLEERQSRRWAELRRGAELRLLAAEPSPDWLRGGYQRALEAPPQRPGQSRAELTAILASGSEPEVLVSIKALFKAREAELHRPHPPRQGQKVADDWLEQAQAVLIGHSPQAVLWALEVAANQSVRELLVGPAPFPEAPPTLRSQIQGCWWSVGGVWAQLPPLLSHLGRLRQRLQHLEQHLEPHLGTQGSSSTANRYPRIVPEQSPKKIPKKSRKKPQKIHKKSTKNPEKNPKIRCKNPQILPQSIPPKITQKPSQVSHNNT